jgi:hypothetical protein
MAMRDWLSQGGCSPSEIPLGGSVDVGKVSVMMWLGLGDDVAL